MSFNKSVLTNSMDDDTVNSIFEFLKVYNTDLSGKSMCMYALTSFLEGTNYFNLGRKEFENNVEVIKKDNLLQGINSLIDSKNIKNYSENLKTGEYDTNLMVSLKLSFVLGYSIWNEISRKIFKLDNEFAKALYKTRNLKLDAFDMKHLPLYCFYIDLTNIEICQGIKLNGVLVNIIEFDDTNTCFMFNFYYDSEITTTPMSFIFKMSDAIYDNGNVYFPYESKLEESDNYVVRDDVASVVNTKCVIDDIITLVFNFISYLTVKKPDIQETAFTKRQRKRYERMNKQNDTVEEYEVGYRFGKTFSLYKDRVEKEYNEHRGRENENKRPKPHLVTAHWHGYWCGEGRTDFEYLWVAPYFKGFGEMDFVIHDCVTFDRPKYSKGEELLYFLLNKHGLSVEKQKYIPSTGKYYDCCVNIDGVDIYIEYDGQQHFRPVKNWDYKATVQSDTEKNEYCRKNNIPLVRIRYDQQLVMNEIIEDIVLHYNDYKHQMNPLISDKEYYSIRK